MMIESLVLILLIAVLIPFVAYVTVKVISYAWLRGEEIFYSEKSQQLGDETDGKE